MLSVANFLRGFPIEKAVFVRSNDSFIHSHDTLPLQKNKAVLLLK